jgi:hypothetical protein
MFRCVSLRSATVRLSFVFALAERKNEIRLNAKYHAAAGKAEYERAYTHPIKTRVKWNEADYSKQAAARATQREPPTNGTRIAIDQ